MSSILKKYNSAREKEENVIGRRIAEARKLKGVSCPELILRMVFPSLQRAINQT